MHESIQISETVPHEMVQAGSDPFPRVINFKFLLQPHQKYCITQYEELGFSSLSQMKDDCTTNSHYLTYTFFFRKVGAMNLGVEGLNLATSQQAKLCYIHVLIKIQMPQYW